MKQKTLSLIIALLFTLTAVCQIKTPVKWSYATKKLDNNYYVVFIKAKIENGWYIYSQVEGENYLPTKIAFEKNSNYQLIGKTAEPKPILKYDKVNSKNSPIFAKEVIFQQKIKVVKGKKFNIVVNYDYQTCNQQECIPFFDKTLVIPIS